jgi:hypothetical protein
MWPCQLTVSECRFSRPPANCRPRSRASRPKPSWATVVRKVRSCSQPRSTWTHSKWGRPGRCQSPQRPPRRRVQRRPGAPSWVLLYSIRRAASSAVHCRARQGSLGWKAAAAVPSWACAASGWCPLDSLPPDMIVHGSDLFWPLVGGDASGVHDNALAQWGAAVREPQPPGPAPRGSLSTPRTVHHHRAEGRA